MLVEVFGSGVQPGRGALFQTSVGGVRRRGSAYFDEWVFRFNRRNSRSRGLLFQRLLQQAVEGDALTYNERRKAGRTRPPPPDRESMRPPNLKREDSGLPWRDLKT